MVTFKAHRRNRELVVPASPTPQGSKTLSDVDTQIPLWSYATMIEFFRRRDTVDGHESPVINVAKAIKEALAKALVYYYPIAGRLREVSKGKLAVDCTGEGVVFVEAHADVRLDELGEPLLPPYPCIEELLCDIGDTKDIVGRPLMFMQVTRFKCGGFSIGVRDCHNMVDGFGLIQFLKCVTDLARGQEHPAVLPVWDRQLLMARDPLDLTSLPFVSDEPSPPVQPMAMDKMVSAYFLFGPREIAALRSQVTEPATDFELITAAMWMCRAEAIALALGCRSAGIQPPRASLLIAMTMNVRGKAMLTPPLPRGYYGNAFVYVEAELRGATGTVSLGGTVELVQKAKRGMTEEHVRTMVDLFSVGRMPPHEQGWTFVVSDITRIGEDQLDLGWAERVAGGVPFLGDDHATSKLVSYQMRCKNADGDDCVVASMYLPEPAMDKFKEKILLILAS